MLKFENNQFKNNKIICSHQGQNTREIWTIDLEGQGHS
jgi:hypothetical protein